MEKCRKYNICNIDLHRAPYAKPLRSKKHLKKETQKELIKPEWILKEPIENII